MTRAKKPAKNDDEIPTLEDLGRIAGERRELREADERAAHLTRFGTTPLEEFAAYNKWCRGYPENRKNVP